MNSRERILAAIHHQEPDGVPVDLGATLSSGISAIAYANLKQHLEIQNGHTRVYDVIQQLAQPEDELLDRYHVDVLDIGRAFNTRDEDWYDFELPQGSSWGQKSLSSLAGSRSRFSNERSSSRTFCAPRERIAQATSTDTDSTAWRRDLLFRSQGDMART